MRRICTPLVLCGCFWLIASSCASPEGDDTGAGGQTGAAGSGPAGSGPAGSTGVAGSGSGQGGSTGVAGSGNSSGVAGSGRGNGGSPGAAGSGPAGSGAGGSVVGSCTVTPTATVSDKMKTVGIVTFTTTGGTVTAGSIDFGLTTSYGMTAPVDTKETSYKTLLLGMKQSKTYHYRVTVTAGGKTCVSDDATIMTGALAAGLQKPSLSPATASTQGLFGGFLITGQFVMGAGAGATAYILDADGDYVWSYGINSDVTTARMSYDGKWMWIQNANVPSGTARVHRVSMDGTMDQDLSTKFAGANHQLTVLPDETVAFYAYGSNGCEDIKEYKPDGTVKTIVNAKTARGGTSACHLNNIQYSKEDDTLVFSDLDTSTITKIKRDGTTVFSIGGTSNTATQTYQGTPWKGGEHGIHILGVDKLLFFRNNSSGVPGGSGSLGGDTSGSGLWELTLNNSAKTYTAKEIFKATSPKIQNDVMGDVQLLPNDNYVIGFSTKGALHELSSSGAIKQTWTWSAGQTFGYIEKRATLYGPGPR
jgi:hypothetical protein